VLCADGAYATPAGDAYPASPSSPASAATPPSMARLHRAPANGNGPAPVGSRSHPARKWTTAEVSWRGSSIIKQLWSRPVLW
jgi:hypothetical protein